MPVHCNHECSPRASLSDDKSSVLDFLDRGWDADCGESELLSTKAPRESPTVVHLTIDIGAEGVPVTLPLFNVSHLGCEGGR